MAIQFSWPKCSLHKLPQLIKVSPSKSVPGSSGREMNYLINAGCRQIESGGCSHGRWSNFTFFIIDHWHLFHFCHHLLENKTVKCRNIKRGSADM